MTTIDPVYVIQIQREKADFSDAVPFGQPLTDRFMAAAAFKSNAAGHRRLIKLTTERNGEVTWQELQRV